MDNYEKESSIWDINTIIDFIKNNYIQILMFLSVFVIIYIVDYISNINAVLFGLPSAVPGLPSPPNNQQKKTNVNINFPKKKKHHKK
jgi:hypothetical protein